MPGRGPISKHHHLLGGGGFALEAGGGGAEEGQEEDAGVAIAEGAHRQVVAELVTSRTAIRTARSKALRNQGVNDAVATTREMMKMMVLGLRPERASLATLHQLEAQASS